MYNKRVINILIIISLILTICTYNETAKAEEFFNNIFYVGGSGEGNYSRIQDAIDNASNGDMVFVYDDSSPYYEQVIINKIITLIGENKETTIIYGNIQFLTDGVTITGFSIYTGGNFESLDYISETLWMEYSLQSLHPIQTEDYDITKSPIVNLKDRYGDLVVVPYSSIPETIKPGTWVKFSFEDNIALDIMNQNPIPLDSDRSYGIIAINSNYNEISDCIFLGCGIFAERFSYSKILGCSFDDAYHAIRLTTLSNNNQIIDCTASNSDGFVFTAVNHSCNNQFINSTVINSLVAVEYNFHSDNNSIINCNFSENYCGYYPINSKNCQIINTSLIHCDYPIPTENADNHRFIGCFGTKAEFGYGIGLLEGSNNCTIKDCNFSYGGWEPRPGYPAQGGGIQIYNCYNVTMRNNTLWKNVNNIWLDGIEYDIDESNTVDNKPIYYKVGMNDTVIDGSSFGFLGLVNCNNITANSFNLYNVSSIILRNSNNSVVENCSLTFMYKGIELIDSSNNTIKNCSNLGNWFYSISIYGKSDNNLITNCKMINSYLNHIIISSDNIQYNNTFSHCLLDGEPNLALHGFHALSISNHYINNCTIRNVSGIGLDLRNANQTQISDCYLEKNKNGITLWENSNLCQISNCSFFDNTYTGVKIRDSSYNNILYHNNFINNIIGNGIGVRIFNSAKNNTIYHNNFMNYFLNAADSSDENNSWDDGYPSGGNFWNDYRGNDNYSGSYQNIPGSDGIGDTPYIHPNGVIDKYPLMLPTRNIPPDLPSINGSVVGEIGESLEYTFVTIEHNNDDIYCYIAWGDDANSGWLGPYPSGYEVTVNHTWTSEGNYEIRAKAKDIHDVEGAWSDPYVIRIGNQAPDKPEINGPTSGISGEKYNYSFVTNDPERDDVFYQIDWGDGDTEEWIGPYPSGQEVIVSHTWDDRGTYTIKAKARDIFEDESDWEYLEVTMPVNQHSYSFPLLQRILELFPNAFPIIRQILGI